VGWPTRQGRGIGEYLGFFSLSTSVKVCSKSIVLGFKIKLESNSYDYEDQYNYTLSVTEDYATGLRVTDTMEEAMASIIAQLLSKNLPLTIAQEFSVGLHLYTGAVS
jgi:hypothetical protein